MIKLTDQYFTYREYPLDYDGAGKLNPLKGNTLVWNQLVQNGNFTSTSNWTSPNGTLSASNNIGRCTFTGGAWNNDFRQAINMTAGHNYLVSFDYLMSNASISVLIFQQVGDSVSLTIQNKTSRTHYNAIYTPASSGTSGIRWTMGANMSSYSGQYYELSNVNIIDLTLLNDSRITDYSSFKTYYPLSYYSYNSGSLLNFNGTGIKTVGFNQWDEEWEVGAYSSIGIKNSSTTEIRNKNFIPVLSNTRYYFNSSVWGVWYAYDEDKNLISRNVANPMPTAFTTPSNCHYINFYLNSAYGTTYKNDICINISSSRNGEYEPYKESTSDLPTLTYFPNGMKSAGSVYDEITESKAITRVGSVDLGSLTWYQLSARTDGFYTNAINPIAKTSTTNLKIVGYTVDNSVASSMANMTVKIDQSDGTYLYLINSAYASNPSGLKASLNGVYLNYELATPTEAEVSDDFIYLGYANGTEQLLPINGATPTTSPLFADIEYYTLMDSETPYRKFWIINNSGEQWDLTEKDFKAFLNNPTGLGFKKTIEMTRYGEKAVKNNETYDFPSVQGELLFYDSANSNRYDKYNQFVRFVMDTPLKLYYQIPVSISSQIADIYFLDCEITELQKTESKPDRLLRSTVTFNGLSFYEGEEITISGSGSSYTIENKGDFPVGFEITIEGSLTNPYITLEQDGELYGEAKFDDSTAFSSVYVNSNDGEQNVVLQQSGTVLPNPLSYQDLSISNGNIYVTFIKLAKGVSTLTIGATSMSITNVEIKYTPAFRSV